MWHSWLQLDARASLLVKSDQSLMQDAAKANERAQ